MRARAKVSCKQMVYAKSIWLDEGIQLLKGASYSNMCLIYTIFNYEPCLSFVVNQNFILKKMRTFVGNGGGVLNGQKFTDVLYGRPLGVLMFNNPPGFYRLLPCTNLTFGKTFGKYPNYTETECSKIHRKHRNRTFGRFLVPMLCASNI